MSLSFLFPLLLVAWNKLTPLSNRPLECVWKATCAPDVHVFGELLDLPQIAELEHGAHSAHFQLLKLFAYGTYPDLKGSCGSSSCFE